MSLLHRKGYFRQRLGPAGTQRELRFATSLLNAEESDLGHRASRSSTGGAAKPAGESEAEAPRGSARGLWRPLVFVALILLVVEAFAFHRRWAL